MVPGSTLMYGSSLMLVTRMLRDSRIAAREAAAMPFPREETTPPVTNTYLVIYPRRVGMEEFTHIRFAPQRRHSATARGPTKAGSQNRSATRPRRRDRERCSRRLPRRAD